MYDSHNLKGFPTLVADGSTIFFMNRRVRIVRSSRAR